MSPLARSFARELKASATALTSVAAVMALGVAIFIAMSGVWRDLDVARSEYYQAHALHDLRIDLEVIPRARIRSLVGIDGVVGARGRVSLNATVELGAADTVSGVALSLPAPRRRVLSDIALNRGTWFSSATAAEVIVIESFARAHGMRIGDRLNVRINAARHRLRIVGFASAPEFVYLLPVDGGLAPDPARSAVLYLADRFAQSQAQLSGGFNQVLFSTVAKDRPGQDKTLKLLANKLDRYGVRLAERADEQPSIRFLSDELDGLKSQSTAMPLIFFIAAALTLNIMMARKVRARRSVIGTLRAIGVGRATVVSYYCLFAAVVGAISGLVGVALGAWLQGLMLALYRQFYAVPGMLVHGYIDLIALGLVLAVAFALAGSLGALREILRLQPAEAMRPPQPASGRHVALERFAILWRTLPGTSRMAIRSMVRNPYRCTVVVLTTAISTALVTCALNMSDAVKTLLEHEFVLTASQDHTVVLNRSVPLSAANEVASLPGVAFAEGHLNIPVQLTAGAAGLRLSIVGLPDESRLYRPRSPDGRIIQIPPRGMVLARRGAQRLGIKVGDHVTLRPLKGRRRSVEVAVTGIADTYLGLSAYTRLSTLARLLGEEPVVTALAVKMHPVATPNLLTEALLRRPYVAGVSSRSHFAAQFEQTFGATMSVMISVMVMISGLIAFGAIFSSALVALEERAREVATLRVLGYGVAEVGNVFAVEAGVLNVLGIGLGLGGGMWLMALLAQAYSTDLYRFPGSVESMNLVFAAVAMTGFVLAALGVVYYLVSKQRWHEVLNTRE